LEIVVDQVVEVFGGEAPKKLCVLGKEAIMKY
jgi:hypothetical protein